MITKNIIFKFVLFVSLVISPGVYGQADSTSTHKKNIRYATFKESDNWFISGGIGIESLLSSSRYSETDFTPIFKLSLGRWFSPFSGIRGQINADYINLEQPGASAPKIGIGVNYLMNFMSLGKYKENRLFELIGSVGAGYDFLLRRSGFRSSNLFSGNIGLQAMFNITPYIGLYAEPQLSLSSDLLDNSLNGKTDILGNITFGVMVRFGKNRFKSFEIKEYEAIDMNRINERINLLNAEIQTQRKLNEPIGTSPCSKEEYTALSAPKSNRKAYYNDRFWDNTYISLGGIGEASINRNFFKSDNLKKNVSPGVVLSLGKWISPIWGMQLNLSGAHARLGNYNYATGTVDFLLNMSSAVAGYNPNRVFSFIPLIGIGWGVSSKDGQVNNSYTFNAAFQGRFNVSKRIDLWAEIRANMVSDKFDKKRSGNWYSGYGGLRIGVAYKLFNSYFKTYDFVNAQHAELLNMQINRMRETLECEKLQELSQYKDHSNNPENNLLSINIKFDEYSSYISKTQLEVLDNIGSWMNLHNDFTIQIAPFRQMNNENVDETLAEQRSSAIEDILVKRYGISRDRISVITPETLGYKNKYDSNVLIIFSYK